MESYDALKAQLIKDLIDEGFIEANPKRWVRPKIEDVNEHFSIKIGHNDLTYVIAKEFFDYWDGLDWKVKNTRIKSWKGRAATWIKNNEKFKRNDSQRFNGISAADKVKASIANRN